MTKSILKKPNTVIGVGLRHSHYPDLLNGEKQNVDFVEVHAENFFAKGGASRDVLKDVTERYPLSLHGTSLGLGSSLPVPASVLTQFAELVHDSKPLLVSEHLCFNRAQVNGKVIHSGDLLPIPYNNTSLSTIVSHIHEVQERIGRSILIENLSAYVQPSQLVPDLKDTMTEFEFLVDMCKKASCGLLLDLNNLIINELNSASMLTKKVFSLDTLKSRLEAIPIEMVGEIHLAGFTDTQVSLDAESTKPNFIIDDHGAAVSEQCWALYDFAIQRFSGTPTLVEWDTQIPEWPVLLGEANKARAIASKYLKSEVLKS